jgi:hypothetical protein
VDGDGSEEFVTKCIHELILKVEASVINILEDRCGWKLKDAATRRRDIWYTGSKKSDMLASLGKNGKIENLQFLRTHGAAGMNVLGVESFSRASLTDDDQRRRITSERRKRFPESHDGGTSSQERIHIDRQV